MTSTACQSPQAARAAIKYRLPLIVNQYLVDIGVDRAWISCSDVLQHFSLGKRERMMSQALLDLQHVGQKRIIPPEKIPEMPIFVREVRERWNTITSKRVRMFLVERNQFYTG